MIISYKWLKEYLITDLDINQISNILTDIGLSVENIKYYNNLMDWAIDIVITPNRSDAISHYGIARDLYAALITREYKAKLIMPSVKNFKKNIDWIPININVENTKKCLRYSGITISKIKIFESPKWLQNRLKIIGINPINNIIDIINFVMFEVGQPMHVFDADKIKGFNIKVTTVNNNNTFLDKINLSLDDLIICDNNNPICLAGIFEGINYKVTNNTKNIFIDSAYFNPLSIRKSVKRHNLNTEHSFRFERGIDPNKTIYALKRAALLIKEIACGYISSDIIDIYPIHISNSKIRLRYNKIYNIIGCKISHNKILQILELLEIKIISKNEESLILSVPLYRIDVKREIDIIEEILRIYGYNNLKSINNYSYNESKKNYSSYEFYSKIEETISQQLLAHGFNEIITISLKKDNYINLLNTSTNKMIVNVINPLSTDLSIMQPNLLFGMLESISYNIKRKNFNLKLFEFGKSYLYKDNNFLETKYLSLSITGKIENIKWINVDDLSFFYLKGIIEQIMQKIGINNTTQKLIFNDHFLYETIIIKYLNYNLFKIGKVRETITKKFDIYQNVFYAEFNLQIFTDVCFKQKNIKYINISKYPGIKRDLSLLLDINILFEDIYYLAINTEKNLLTKVKLFDIYHGKQLPIGKKSYAISFYFESKKQTLTNQIIDEIMNKLKQVFKEKLGAEIRK
ncbi:MAG: phenylalanine--tRNA ligase subunit beta [Candidatus Bostrichicola ureolyticus]|nr:MAG: phenylalanine--tRNA ligase subunit beta [Candidatus Bostrichicola ureolyticus]